MDSFEIIRFKCSLEAFINSSELPKEVIRMIIAEIFKKVSDQAYQEVMEQMKEKEKENNGNTDQNEV